MTSQIRETILRQAAERDHLRAVVVDLERDVDEARAAAVIHAREFLFAHTCTQRDCPEESAAHETIRRWWRP